MLARRGENVIIVINRQWEEEERKEQSRKHMILSQLEINK